MSASSSSSLHAVITADVVKSTSRIPAERREAFADELRAAYARIQEQLPEALPYPIAVFGGDSWQCYVEDPKAALRVGLYLRAWTRFAFDVDTRFALAINTVDFVNPRNVAESDGNVFRQSGSMVEQLEGDERLMIWSMLAYGVQDRQLPQRLATMGELLATAEEAVARLGDRIARSWTAAQAQVVMWRLLDSSLTHEDIAERWAPEPVTHQSISKHLARAGWYEVDRTLKSYKNVVESATKIAAWLDEAKPVEPQ